ncbi:uncharacterized protein BX664DRAFT_343586 [Halteromyces radiatus]|uniref:uncharacterized protein n=1 Tax=Halteromyces radiatus TaxID=101107 RepID=UPI00221EA0A4|nr:uncharacterized protein BX664DRAFT_343586 [Halteromyces radiatus]KAI8077828.1 hypothetical protein BX664DRAFT_343586 [Halteromyces radiatus]
MTELQQEVEQSHTRLFESQDEGLFVGSECSFMASSNHGFADTTSTSSSPNTLIDSIVCSSTENPFNTCQETPVTETHKCTRCKRWRSVDLFKNDDPTQPRHAGCLECRENARKYGQSEYGKATRRQYNQTAKAKETRKKYAQSEKGRESRKKYAQSEKAKEARRKYSQSEKAKETRRRRIQARQKQKKQEEQTMIENTFELVPSYIGSITFDEDKSNINGNRKDKSKNNNNNDMKSMEKAFWQTVSRTIYDRSKEEYDKYIEQHDNLEVDIRLKYRRTK